MIPLAENDKMAGFTVEKADEVMGGEGRFIEMATYLNRRMSSEEQEEWAAQLASQEWRRAIGPLIHQWGKLSAEDAQARRDREAAEKAADLKRRGVKPFKTRFELDQARKAAEATYGPGQWHHDEGYMSRLGATPQEITTSVAR